MLSEAPEAEFRDYLERGDEQLRHVPIFRASIIINEVRYYGTAWEGLPLPRFLIGDDQSRGAFIDGLAEPIIDALRSGRVEDILQMEVQEQVGRDAQYVRIILDDGRARAWAPSITQLIDHP